MEIAQLKRLEDQLEILVFTYNRASYLERTLAQLLDSPFAGCKLTVLDNCSTDATPEVCAKYERMFGRFCAVRHRKNIGLEANYLRAVELSETQYTWILGDDDLFDFSDCADVIEKIENGDFDMIYLNDLGACGWERGMRTTSAHLANNASNYFLLLSFVNNFIFKTERFDSECIMKGYRSAGNLFPHFEFSKKSVRNNFSFYVSKQKIVFRGDDNQDLGALTWFAAWVNNCRTLDDRKLRRATVYELPYVNKSRTRWLKKFASYIVTGKLAAPEKVPEQIRQIVLGLSADQRLLFLLISPLVLIPSSVYNRLRILRKWIHGKSYAEVKQSSDIFRS